MKFLKFLVSFIQKIIGFVNIFLILIIVLNLVNIIASKVQDNGYISFLGYTYVNVEEDNKALDLEKGDFVLIDLNRAGMNDDMILYQEDDELKLGNITAIGTEDVLLDEETHVDKESVLGTVVSIIPILGTILTVLLDSQIFFWAIIILIATSIIQTLLSRTFKAIKAPKPDLNQISKEDMP